MSIFSRPSTASSGAPANRRPRTPCSMRSSFGTFFNTSRLMFVGALTILGGTPGIQAAQQRDKAGHDMDRSSNAPSIHKAPYPPIDNTEYLRTINFLLKEDLNRLNREGEGRSSLTEKFQQGEEVLKKLLANDPKATEAMKRTLLEVAQRQKQKSQQPREL